MAVELGGCYFYDGVQLGWEVFGYGRQVAERLEEDFGGYEVRPGICQTLWKVSVLRMPLHTWMKTTHMAPIVMHHTTKQGELKKAVYKYILGLKRMR